MGYEMEEYAESFRVKDYLSDAQLAISFVIHLFVSIRFGFAT